LPLSSELPSFKFGGWTFSAKKKGSNALVELHDGSSALSTQAIFPLEIRAKQAIILDYAIRQNLFPAITQFSAPPAAHRENALKNLPQAAADTDTLELSVALEAEKNDKIGA
jgi:hypothetical protein